MRVLLVHRWFWPDSPPYAEMLRVIAARLAADGHQVRVLTAQPSYTSTTTGRKMPRREQLDGFEVVRARLLPESKRNFVVRALNTALFALAILRQGFSRGGWGAVMTSTMPPVLIGWAGRGCARLGSGAFLYHMMDIHPEAAALGGLMKRGWAYRMLRAIDRRNCARARKVFVLSADMRTTLHDRGLDTANIEVVDNFELQGSEAGAAAAASGQPYTVLFAGNIGRFQALDGLLGAARRLQSRAGELRFLFLGEGVGLAKLRDAADQLPSGLVEFRGHVPVAEARAAMEAADLGVVALAEGIHRVAFPSKTMTYACVGLPMLGLVEAGSSLAELLQRHDLGAVEDPADEEAIAAAIETELSRTPEDRLARRERVRAHGEAYYARGVAENRWSAVFAELAEPDRRS